MLLKVLLDIVLHPHHVVGHVSIDAGLPLSSTPTPPTHNTYNQTHPASILAFNKQEQDIFNKNSSFTKKRNRVGSQQEETKYSVMRHQGVAREILTVGGG